MKRALYIAGAVACWAVFAWAVSVAPERPSRIPYAAELLAHE